METARFERKFFSSENQITRIGSGSLGGKARGLMSVLEMMRETFFEERFPGVRVSIPHMTVITTEIFDAFMAQNELYDLDLNKMKDDRIAHRFQQTSLPPQLVGDLRALAKEVHMPLAVRSSGLLEDAMYQPFAGVYATKMIPNNQPSPDVRFQKLVEAIKFVFASTFFRNARYYRESVGRGLEDERMAVIIQEIVGQRRGPRFYPTLSGVARSFNFYPHGHATPDCGVVDLALGLGKTIVDGGKTWSYSPSCPKAPPPYNSTSDMMKSTQTEFWAVNMGRPPAHDPLRETEYLVRAGLLEAERDTTLRHVASTYVPADDRVVPGLGCQGPRIVDFSPLLVVGDVPLNPLLRDLMGRCEAALEEKVEIEFAADLGPARGYPVHVGFLQVRPMVVFGGQVAVPRERLAAADVRVASENALGNGIVNTIEDVVYIKPETFEPRQSVETALEIEHVNGALRSAGRPYLLVGFGRIGTSDPWRGIPGPWSRFSGARVIVEVERRGMETPPSQGSHFFHNMTSNNVCYFSVPLGASFGVDWDFFRAQEAVDEHRFVRHVRVPSPLVVMVDGRTRRGVVCHDA
jgi:hypothetical protein